MNNNLPVCVYALFTTPLLSYINYFQWSQNNIKFSTTSRIFLQFTVRYYCMFRNAYDVHFCRKPATADSAMGYFQSPLGTWFFRRIALKIVTFGVWGYENGLEIHWELRHPGSQESNILRSLPCNAHQMSSWPWLLLIYTSMLRSKLFIEIWTSHIE